MNTSVFCFVFNPQEEQLSALAPEANDEAPAMESRLPPYAQNAKDVLERCIHLLSHKSLRMRLKVLLLLR